MVAERQAILAEIEQSKKPSAPFDLERVVLGVCDDILPSPLPSVRIFRGGLYLFDGGPDAKVSSLH